MNIHILGAGSVGCLWAAHLELSAKRSKRAHEKVPALDISFISTRNQPANTIQFKLESSFLNPSEHKIPIEFTFPVCTANQLENSIDHLLVCTKSFDTLPALKAIKNVISDNTNIILFQNGLGSQFEILKLLPNNPIFAAVTTEGANRPQADVVIHAGKGKTYIGALNSKASNKTQLAQLQSTFKQIDLVIEHSEDIWQALWQKLAINCAINPFTAILNCRNGQVRESELFKGKWPDLSIELFELLKIAGHPISISEIETLVFDVMRKTHQNISSMLQDVRANKVTEIEHICGFAFQRLEENNICAPTLKYLYNEVQRKSKK